VHGHLHPGNVLVKTTTTKQERSNNWWSSNESDAVEITRRSIVFLDAGISTSLSPNDQRNLRDLFRAIIFNDFQ
jgi:predicted unusual protein kinase regulating ubiquinone biosynthesis (AarF/ABC1/UbiB family)